MQQWPYAKEPFDTKLFVLRFMKQIYLVVCAALIGAVLLGGGYYLKKVVFGGPVEYEMTTTYFIDYITYNEETGEIYNYTNSATWESWVATDWFVDRAWEYALEAGMVAEKYNIQKSDLAGYFYATMPTDLRIPQATVTTPHEELTVLLNGALQKTFFDFAESRPEMEKITIVDETEPIVADKDVRTLRAVVLGAVLGAFVAGFGLAFALIWDDSVVVPESMAYRYGFSVAGFVGKDAQVLSEETGRNIQYLLRDRKNNGLVTVGKALDAKKLLEIFPKELVKNIAVTGKAETMDEIAFEKLRDSGCVLLLVEAGGCSGKEIEHVLQTMKLQDCEVVGALLCNADCSLIRYYRFGCKK